jgi:predicted ATPase
MNSCNRAGASLLFLLYDESRFGNEATEVNLMFTRMKLKNFKSWQSLDIELAPLTVLFGTNSSGKTSILQAFLLLLQSYENTDGESIDFGGRSKDYVNLGSFRDVIYRHNTKHHIRIFLEMQNIRLGKQLEGLGLSSKHNNEIDISFKLENDDIKFLAGFNRGRTSDIWNDIVYNNDPSIQYLGPLRQHPQRSYLWSGAAPAKIMPDGENTIAALIESDRRDKRVVNQVSEWLAKMELVNKFRVAPLDEGKRFYETLVDIGGTETALLDTGFGISQVLPVITMLFFAPEGSIILIEQPELHLHPRAQAHLADLLLYVAEHRKLQLIIESHSEHLLRRLQRRIAEHEHEYASPENIRMYFCDTGENGSTIQAVKVDEYGQINNWPDKFFGDITGDLEAMTMAALQRAMNGKN